MDPARGFQMQPRPWYPVPNMPMQPTMQPQPQVIPQPPVPMQYMPPQNPYYPQYPVYQSYVSYQPNPYPQAVQMQYAQYAYYPMPNGAPQPAQFPQPTMNMQPNMMPANTPMQMPIQPTIQSETKLIQPPLQMPSAPINPTPVNTQPVPLKTGPRIILAPKVESPLPEGEQAANRLPPLSFALPPPAINQPAVNLTPIKEEEAKELEKLSHKKENGVYRCHKCERTYLSYPALYTHNKIKHPPTQAVPVSKPTNRGRPKKNVFFKE